MFLDLAAKIDDESIKNIISNTSTSEATESHDDESERKANIIRVFMDLFQQLIMHLHEDVSNFLADLISLTPEQYAEESIDIDVQILEQMMEAPEVENFFTGVSRIFSAAPWYKKGSDVLKDKLGSIVDAAKKS